ncbi:ABC transporter ATP-binding protein [Aureimonas sp. AU4]|uniref:ABC transporter ATP-binding protein n=1 Tax=Aureimonas sp. AU4 TaxID=1638163 RepID=UPI000706BD1A|nr:ABC transporter ATP-binding protein [Aureimonas sp. AU4]BAT30387.1 oligopeptide/dipeptide ABC transporter ATPase [Aureimonas sp. AU4]
MSADASASTAEPILEGRNLVKRFGGGGFLQRRPAVHALNDVSLTVRRGEVFAVVGESGCGKSTLGRVLLDLISPTSGEVRFEGRAISGAKGADALKLRRELQIVFQDPFASINPRMSAGEVVGEPIWLHGLRPAAERRERVAELFRTVGLRPAMMDRFPHEFSGGQRQRIGIARALACEPKLLLGDEPVSALDVSIQAQIVNLLEELKERLGLTLVVVAHDLAVIRHMSDRVAVMYLGEIVEEAPTEPLFDQPLHPYTMALMEAIPQPSPLLKRERQLLEGDVPNPVQPPSGCKFHTRCPHAKARCSTDRPVLETADASGRRVACHFWREIQAAGSSASLPLPPPNERLDRRLALYRQWQAAKPASEIPA